MDSDVRTLDLQKNARIENEEKISDGTLDANAYLFPPPFVLRLRLVGRGQRFYFISLTMNIVLSILCGAKVKSKQCLIAPTFQKKEEGFIKLEMIWSHGIAMPIQMKNQAVQLFFKNKTEFNIDVLDSWRLNLNQHYHVNCFFHCFNHNTCFSMFLRVPYCRVISPVVSQEASGLFLFFNPNICLSIIKDNIF